ncbi:hypothetical protein EHQ53_15415 [Leptospira langatensis]|uniref:Uncharacterized protein n=1 Tax=Leptospira langatensis TaxID=2484983 RepID=A0A5F1ZSS3_9LEPT|nr:hypothetical protein [Leptospira langatensis]TGK01858.1 hypothetical protein EHO57_08655 [Leptospira langatensis]TGL39545.1 hypothetical protein EHQ53_15415 [Leptospira langatensis]
MKNTPIKIKILYITLILFAAFAVLDRFLLDQVLFGFPNEQEWDTSPWFNFLEKRRRIEFSSNEEGVLVVGSSVALYSVLPERMNQSFRKDSLPIRAEFYAHPAMTPSDFYFYREDIASKNPKLVFYVLNPADLQLDFLISEKEAEARLQQYEKNIMYQDESVLDLQKIQYDENALTEMEVKTRHQNRSIYPWEYLKERYSDVIRLGKSSFLSLLSRSLFLVVRYRSFMYDPFDIWIENHLRSGRSYHYYTGILPKEGIYLRGWAKPEFEINCELNKGVFQESVFFQEKGANLKIRGEGDKVLFDQTFPTSGWHMIRLEFSKDQKTVPLKFSTDKKISSSQVDARLFGLEETYGIRLSRNFCRREIQKDISYIRILGLDDSRLFNMDEETYSKDYQERVYAFKSGAKMSRLVTLRMAKIKLAASPRFFAWSELEYLKKGIEYLGSKGIKVVIVNSPENPFERKVYENSPWYSGYIQFLETLGAADYSFKNAVAEFPNQNSFLDPHHLTYMASERSSDLFARWIRESLDKK